MDFVWAIEYILSQYGEIFSSRLAVLARLKGGTIILWRPKAEYFPDIVNCIAHARSALNKRGSCDIMYTHVNDDLLYLDGYHCLDTFCYCEFEHLKLVKCTR